MIGNPKAWGTPSTSNYRGSNAIHWKLSSLRWSLGKRSENTSRHGIKSKIRNKILYILNNTMLNKVQATLDVKG